MAVQRADYLAAHLVHSMAAHWGGEKAVKSATRWAVWEAGKMGGVGSDLWSVEWRGKTLAVWSGDYWAAHLVVPKVESLGH